MSTLLLRLVGPMQSWGISSRFDQRDTSKEPSKSGVIGLVAAAMGIARENWRDLEPLTLLEMALRHDRAGIPRRDFQTAQQIISADQSKKHDTAITYREYLADAAFLVGLAGDDRDTLERAYHALRDPVWPLALGRKSYLPSESIWIPDGLVDQPLREAILSWPWIGTGKAPERVIYSWESTNGSGSLRMDQPLSCFAERCFGTRFVQSEWVQLTKGAPYVAT